MRIVILRGNAQVNSVYRERDIILARGCAASMTDAMMKRGNQYFMWVCRYCGQIAIFNIETKRKWCKACNVNEIVPIKLPYVTTAISQIFGGMGLTFRFLTEPEK